MKSILPVVNGVLMALTEIFNIIATLVGFKLDEFDYSGLAGVSDYANDIIEGFDGAGASVDKLKKKLSGLRSFDKLNVISSQKGTSSGTGSGSGTIDPKILKAFSDAFSGYNDQLDKVKMKANDIRDSIMKWLGFTKKINPLTGEISWEYGGIKKTLKNIWESFTKLNPLAKIFTGFAVWKSFKLLVNWGGKLLNILGVGGLAKSIKNVFNDLGRIKGDLPTLSSNMDRFKTAVSGVAIAFLGREGLVNALEAINREGPSATRILEATVGGLAEVAGFTMIGSAFGPIGAGIGLIVGTVATLITAIENSEYKFDALSRKIQEDLDIEGMKNFNDELERQFKLIDDNAQKELVATEIHQGMYNELERIVDENGKVKAGYEKRAEFIITELNNAYGLEIKMVDGVIQQYDKQKKKIQEVIDVKRLETIENVAREKYKIALENEAKARQNLTKVEKEYNELEKERTEVSKKLWKAIDEGNDAMAEQYSKRLAEIAQAKNDLLPTLEQNRKEYKETQRVINEYGNVVEAVNKKNVDEAKAYLDEMLQEHEQEKDIYKLKAEEAKTAYNERKALIEEKGREATKAEKFWLDEGYRQLGETLVKENQAIKDNSDDYVSAWVDMAQHSESEFLEYFKKLPDDVQQQVVSKMYDLGYDISDELQKGINSINPKIKFGMDTSAIKTALQKLKKTNPGINTWFQMAGTSIDTVISKLAVGGMPPVGQLFVANEKGPELVGNIGGQSFVANQNQMMDLLDKKIGNAQNNTRPQVFNIYLDENHKLGSYTIEQLQNIAKTDGKPITIG